MISVVEDDGSVDVRQDILAKEDEEEEMDEEEEGDSGLDSQSESDARPGLISTLLKTGMIKRKF